MVLLVPAVVAKLGVILSRMLGIVFMWGLGRTILRLVGTMLATWWQFVYLSIASVTAPVGRYLAILVTKRWMKQADEWAPFVSEAIQHITGMPVDPEMLKKVGTVHGQAEVQKALARAYLDHILGLILPEGPIKPEDGKKAAEAYLGVNLGFQMTGWLLHLMGDIYSMGQFKSIKDLPNAISWSFGLGWLSWLVMGTPFRIAISEPLERYFHEVYVPKQLTLEQLIEMHQRDYLPYEDLVKQARFLGFGEDVLRNRIDLASRLLTSSEVKKLYLDHGAAREDTWKRLKKLGYKDSTADVLIKMWDEERLISQREALAKDALTLFEKGRMTEADVRTYLEAARWQRDEIELQLEVSRLRATPVRTLSLSRILRAWKRGILMRGEAYDKIVGLGYTPEDAELILRTEEVE